MEIPTAFKRMVVACRGLYSSHYNVSGLCALMSPYKPLIDFQNELRGLWGMHLSL